MAQFSLSTFDLSIINRLLRRGMLDFAARLLNYFFLLCSVVLLISAIFFFFRRYSETRASIEQLDITKNNSLSREEHQITEKKERQLALISQAKIFGELGAKATPAPTAVAIKPATKLPLELIGTFISAGQAPYAIIEDTRKKQQDVFNLGQMIFNEAKLRSIFSDRVELERNNQIEVLKLDDVPEQALDTKDGVASVGENQFFIAEAELDKALENLPLLLTQARAVPYFKDGRAVGLRLFAIRSDSLFERIGLRNGDILKTINGNSMGDITQAIKLFEKLKEEKNLALILERNNEEKEFRYQIR
ncbi:MAG TPA: type II secretion system protein N [Oligoflexia bacterium]|nr:type II secretion system protein N [Oligoflexia bacterium]HMP27064.1 type II secretion system protein N [Oligoflexia bacterium]